ncbi:Heavy metal-associated domain, HMA [Artemisia annua]|uniref:Heavy metal-associated domain, HMA n=1 Tax=Artemisia annua TaxID=35608 RepID=A0A2U1QJH6_ARTAN|nr:Heavy metal-associated domain, HMA [Artemisia annua]
MVSNKTPVADEYDVVDVQTLIFNKAPFLKFPEPFLCWAGLSCYYSLGEDVYHVYFYQGKVLDIVDLFLLKDPLQVEVPGRALRDGESKILDVAIRRLVPLHSVAFRSFVSSSVSATPERDADVQGEDSVEDQHRFIGHVERLVLSPDSSSFYGSHGTEVYLHCEACVRKVLKALRGFDGVDKVEPKLEENQVIVNGTACDPYKIADRVRRKLKKFVTIISQDQIKIKQEKKPEIFINDPIFTFNETAWPVRCTGFVHHKELLVLQGLCVFCYYA